MVSSCTSVTFTDLSIQQLHEKIAAGEIVRPGETARIATVDGEQHEIMVSAISADSVTGKVSASTLSDADDFEHGEAVPVIDTSIPIDDILSVEKVQVTNPVGQAAVIAGFSAAYIILLMLPAAIVMAFAL
jgi:hypothetical protein